MLLPSMQAAMIARYRVGRVIGAGGIGEVYLAEDEVLQRKVALKLLPVRFTQDQERVRRFQREARAASALNHPNILTIYEIGHSDSVHYIATEYIEGETLRDVMSSRRLAIGEVIDIAIANERARPPSAAVPNLPPELERIVLKALEKERDARYPSARQLLSDLRALRQQLEFENKLMSLDPHHSTPAIEHQATAPMSFPTMTSGSSSGSVMKVRRVMRSARVTTAAGIAI